MNKILTESAQAYRDLKQWMLKDPNFEKTWRCNITLPAFDVAGKKLTPEEAKEITNRLMTRIFNAEMKTKEYGNSI